MRQATAMRRASQWVIPTFEGSFQRLKDRLIHEENGERKLIVLLNDMMFKVRENTVGISQVRNIFIPYFSTPTEFLL